MPHLQMQLPTNLKEQQQYRPVCKQFYTNVQFQYFFISQRTLSLNQITVLTKYDKSEWKRGRRSNVLNHGKSSRGHYITLKRGCEEISKTFQTEPGYDIT